MRKLTPEKVIDRQQGCRVCNLVGINKKSESVQLKGFGFTEKRLEELCLVKQDTSVFGGGYLWDVTCKVCAVSKVVMSSSLHNGTFGCECNQGKKKEIFYINSVYDDNGHYLCLKYGISNNYHSRLKSCNNKNAGKVLKTLKVFNTPYAQDVETLLKAELTPALPRTELVEGYTETCLTKDYDRIIKLLKEVGALEVTNEYNSQG